MPRFTSDQGRPMTLNGAFVVSTMPALDPKGTPIIGVTAVLLSNGMAVNVRGSHDAVDTSLGLAEKKGAVSA